MRWLCRLMLTFSSLVWQSTPLQSQEKNIETPVTMVAGRTIEYWISEIPSVDPSKSENALRAVMLFGPERAYQAVPVIIDVLRKHSPSTKKHVDDSVRVNGALAGSGANCGSSFNWISFGRSAWPIRAKGPAGATCWRA